MAAARRCFVKENLPLTCERGGTVLAKLLGLRSGKTNLSLSPRQWHCMSLYFPRSILLGFCCTARSLCLCGSNTLAEPQQQVLPSLYFSDLFSLDSIARPKISVFVFAPLRRQEVLSRGGRSLCASTAGGTELVPPPEKVERPAHPRSRRAFALTFLGYFMPNS
jgi:hypothetical protein